MENAPENPSSNIKFTDDQVDQVIDAIRETNGEYDFVYIGHVALILIGMYRISALFSLVMGLVMSGVSQKQCVTLEEKLMISFQDFN